MKKITVSILAALCALSVLSGLSGCALAPSGKSGRLSVVTTIFAPYDFVRQIAGDRADNTMLLKPGTEAHSYEPTPQDIIRLRECDLFIYVGGENDAWVEEILSSIDTSSMKIIRLLDCVEKRYEEEFVEGMDGRYGREHGQNEAAAGSDQGEDTDRHGRDDDTGEYGHGRGEEPHAEWDEHVWTSPVNAILICEAITETLVQIDGTSADFYRQNLETYRSGLEEVDALFRRIVENAGHDTLVFGDRFPLRYFVEEYGLKYYAAFPGCASETEASAATVAFLIDEVKREGIPIVFKIELSNDNMARTIAGEAGARVETFYTGHNLSRRDYENGETYLTLMRRNAEILEEALDGWH